MSCQGTITVMSPTLPLTGNWIAFTAEQMSKLSDILEAALPQCTSSPASRTTSRTPDSIRGNPEPLQPSRKQNRVTPPPVSPFGDIAKEFGVEAHLVEALAHRLSRLS